MNSFIVILETTTKQVMKKVAINAAIGGAADGAIAVVDGKSFIKELGCGIVTAGAGTAATEAFRHFVKATGPLGHATGIIASIGARYTYRRIFNSHNDVVDDDDKGVQIKD